MSTYMTSIKKRRVAASVAAVQMHDEPPEFEEVEMSKPLVALFTGSNAETEPKVEVVTLWGNALPLPDLSHFKAGLCTNEWS